MHRLGQLLPILLLAACAAWPAQAQDSNELAEMQWEPPVVTNPTDAVTLWFPVGEKLTYSVHWGVLQVATAVITTDWVRWPDGRLLLRIRYNTQSNRLIETVYPVKDQIDSYIDPIPFLPVRFVKNMSEGSRRELSVTDFNHAAGTARWRKKVRHYKDWTLPIPSDIRDLPSLSYWLRRDAFHGGTTTNYQVMADDKIYALTLTAKDKKESISVPDLGFVPALQVHPEAAFEGLFVRTGKLALWISKGAPNLLLRMDAEVPVAKVRMRLIKIEGPDSDSWESIWPSVTK